MVEPLLKKFHNIDSIVTVDEKSLLAGSSSEKLLALVDVWKKLCCHRYDLVVTGHADPRYRLLSLTTFAKERRNFNRAKKRAWPVQGRHHSDEYVRLITNVDGPEAVRGELPTLDIPLSDDLRARIKKTGASPVVAFAPGGAKNVIRDDAIRRWPLKCYVALANKLITNGVQVIITGASSDQWICESFSNLDVINLVGMTTLIELISVYGTCDLIVTHDSSPLHLAGLAGTPVVALFGPTNPFEKVPHKEQSRMMWGGDWLACRPCYDGKNYAPCKKNICMQSLSVEMVYESVLKFLKGKKNCS
jgi:heptosyltransferase-2